MVHIALLLLLVLVGSMFPVSTVRASGQEDQHSTLASDYHEAAQKILQAALTNDEAYRRLSELCDDIGHRLSGSRALDEAIEWSAARMRDDGLAVRLQPVMVPHWVRGRESLKMVEPAERDLAMLGLGRSVATPRSGLTADVLVVRSFEELAGLPDEEVKRKIVLYNVPFTTYGETVRYRSRGAIEAAKRGAAAALVRSVGPVSLRSPHTGAMRYEDGVPQIPAAAVSIEDAEMLDRMSTRGLPVRLRLKMQAKMRGQVLSHNVIGELRGRERPEEVVVIGGHLDSWDVGQGAHDDAGGCIVAMEAARLIHELGFQPRRTLRVVLWTNEENGGRGAAAYRDSLGDSVSNHVAAIESDIGVEAPTGFGVRVLHEEDDPVALERHKRAVARGREIATLLADIGADTIEENGGGADIGPLMRAGVPGLGQHTVRELYWHIHHTEADTVDKVDPEDLNKNIAAMAVMAYVLAEMPDRLDDPRP